MRLAVSGSHGAGKSTLIAAFLAQRPGFAHEPEAFETLGDEVDLTDGGIPTAEGLHMLLEHTARTMAAYGPGARVVHERSPIDYLAYAAASRGAWPKGDVSRFLAAHVPLVRACLEHLDAIAFVPVSSAGPDARPDESPRFRRRVDEHLRRALVDDEWDLFGPGGPRVVELPRMPQRWLGELIRLADGPTSSDP